MNSLLDYLSWLVATAYAQSTARQSVELFNPLGSNSDIFTILQRLFGYLIYIAAPVAAILVLYGGFKIATSAGNPQKYSEGVKTIVYAAVGYGIILVSWGVISLVKQLLGVPASG